MNTKTNVNTREIQGCDLDAVTGGVPLVVALGAAAAAAAVYDSIEDRFCSGSCVKKAWDWINS